MSEPRSLRSVVSLLLSTYDTILLLATLLRYLAPPLFLPLTMTVRVIRAGVQLLRTSAVSRIYLFVPARHVT